MHLCTYFVSDVNAKRGREELANTAEGGRRERLGPAAHTGTWTGKLRLVTAQLAKLRR